MKEFIKQNWFKLGILIIVGLGTFTYLFFKNPIRNSSKVLVLDKDLMVSMENLMDIIMDDLSKRTGEDLDNTFKKYLSEQQWGEMNLASVAMDNSQNPEIQEIASVILLGNYKAGFKSVDISEITITDDAFVGRVLSNDLNYDNLYKIYNEPRMIDETPKGEYFSKKNNKLISFNTNNRDKIRFIKGDYSPLPINMFFQSNKITLDKDIKIGIDKSILEKKFGLKIPSNSLKIISQEGYLTLDFTFVDNKLYQITFENTYIE